jgi:hypothetical protein
MQPTKGAARRLGVSLADIWMMLRGPKGKVALALCVLPFGTGAAINLMPSVAPPLYGILAKHSTRRSLWIA